uniref:Uncharacterized protein n=1 Tax=Triticum urartu TaxID=4572 RepID=A0A8R7R6V6_TRIUA
MKDAGLLEAKTDRRGRSTMTALMGVEECTKTLRSLSAGVAAPAAASQPHPDLLRQVRALRHRPCAHLEGCWKGDQCEQDGQGRMQSEDPNSGLEAWAEGLRKIKEQLDHDKDVGGGFSAMWDYCLTFHSYFRCP